MNKSFRDLQTKFRLTSININSMIVVNVYLVACVAAVHAAPETRIVDGVKADKGEWPWQLALYIGTLFNCGGSILGPTWGVTAAYCVGGAPNSYQMIAGTNLNRISCGPSECFIRVLANATRHPNYTAIGQRGHPNDLAYIAWESPIPEFSGDVNVKYAMRATTDDQIGKNCYVTGWGRLSGYGPLPIDLYEAKVGVISKEQCRKYWGDKVSDSQICVQDLKDFTSGPCTSDNGGPLVCEVAPKIWELVGVASWGAAKCNASYPFVYTRMTSFNNWLDGQVKPKY
ncbi:hypothetical protein HELRODRAFT_177891 [Helobdella robusta]|uniref:Peptidase S1 domain-containing protein n=1 Tax=Helobdella robusta TaxID=6412 RepID=T1FCF5_HELRO|nr:hypothetical protein HELRODRAFT_177891 [Helobdella robusta]ESN97470.1 hypothetical protein HELRODRAFT_177891 [Helobdella robusta]